MKLHGLWRSERGFSLVEVMATVTVLMIVLAIASSTWFGVVESRRVDSATTQLAADLRQAHSRAINRLADQTVTLTAQNSEYTLPGGVAADLDDNDPTPGPAGDAAYVTAATTIVFKGDGSAQVTGAGLAANPIRVRATNNPGNFHRIEINPVTSRIKIVP